jgi:hypothetical protein
MDDERFLYSLKSFRIICSRGDNPENHHIYEQCAWNTIHVASTLDQVTLTADFSVPGFQTAVAR